MAVLLTFLYECTPYHLPYMIISALAVLLIFVSKKRLLTAIGWILFFILAASIAGNFQNPNEFYPPYIAIIYSLIPMFVFLLFKIIKSRHKQTVDS